MLAFSKRSSSNCFVSSATFDSAVISLSCAAHHAGEEYVKRVYALVEWHAGTHAGGSGAHLFTRWRSLYRRCAFLLVSLIFCSCAVAVSSTAVSVALLLPPGLPPLCCRCCECRPCCC